MWPHQSPYNQERLYRICNCSPDFVLPRSGEYEMKSILVILHILVLDLKFVSNFKNFYRDFYF